MGWGQVQPFLWSGSGGSFPSSGPPLPSWETRRADKASAHCCVSTLVPQAVFFSNCSFAVAVTSLPSAKKGECCVPFFVLF